MAKAKFGSSLFLCQGILVIFFVVFVDYGDDFKENSQGTTKDGDGEGKASVFQNVHVSTFLGFGLIMTFLRRYSRGMLIHVFLIGALVIQYATLLQGFFTMTHEKKVDMSLQRMINADFAVIAIFISFGAIMGKCNSLQLLIIALIETFFYAVNENINLNILKVSDVGRSMIVHVFGAYFGLAVSRMIFSRKVCTSQALSMSNKSEMYSFVGTLFLWTYWPSVNSSFVKGTAQNRALANTFYALASSCVATFSFTVLQSKESKFNVFHLQNATLAGGIAVGSVAAMFLHPWGAVIVGSIGALGSVLGYKFLVPKLRHSLKIHDTRGVHAAHGVPGILSGVASIIVALLANEDNYGSSLYSLYPARAPVINTTQYTDLQKIVKVAAGENRKAYVQALHQLACLGLTITLAIVGGLITGLVIRLKFFDPVSVQDAFDDHLDFEEHNCIDVSLDGEWDYDDDEKHHDDVHGKPRIMVDTNQSVGHSRTNSGQSLLANHHDSNTLLPQVHVSAVEEPNAADYRADAVNNAIELKPIKDDTEHKLTTKDDAECIPSHEETVPIIVSQETNTEKE